MQMPFSPAEDLLNYIVHHTDLYMRRGKGKTENQRWTEAFYALRPWLETYRERVLKEAREGEQPK